MKNKPIYQLIIGVIIIVISLITTFVVYKGSSELTIYATKDSYAYKYAKNNLIKTYEISDSDLESLTLHLEDFKVDLNNNKIEITKYEGKSEKLYIPKQIDGINVVSVAKDALPDNVKIIVIPETITSLDEESINNLEIQCYKNDYCKSLKEDKNLNVVYLSDNELTYINNSTKNYSYNINNDEITINNYLAKDKVIVIPETINGYKVVKVSIDGKGIEKIYIPNTINSISDDIISADTNKVFRISIIIEIITLIVFIGITIIDNKKELKEKVYLAPKTIVSLLYILVSLLLVYFIYNNQNDYRLYLIIFAFVSLIYIVLGIVLSKTKTNNIKYDEKIKHTGDFIKEVDLLLDEVNIKEYSEVREKIKYSDPVSSDDVKNIEDEIKKAIKEKKDSKEIIYLIEKRNKILKNNK